jgi:hypothetical protein
MITICERAGRHDAPHIMPFGIQHVADQLAHAPGEIRDEARADCVRATGAADIDGLAAGRRHRLARPLNVPGQESFQAKRPIDSQVRA